MIRSSRTTTRMANAAKSFALGGVLAEYRRVVREFIVILWMRPHKEVRSLLDKDTIAMVPSSLSARLMQCAAKQASAIVRGTRTKTERMLWQHGKLVEEGRYKRARRLLASIRAKESSMPNVTKELPMELDERFCRIDLTTKTKEFDGWLTLASSAAPIAIALNAFVEHET